MIGLLVLTWFALGLAGAGFALRYDQKEEPHLACATYNDETWSAIVICILGPIGVALTIWFVGFGVVKHGWGLSHVCPDPHQHGVRQSQC